MKMRSVVESRERLRGLYEVEREMIRTLTTWIYRVGEPEQKYMLCQHVWESAQHAKFLRIRGEELGNFGRGMSARGILQHLFEAGVQLAGADEAIGLYYGVLKPMLKEAYGSYLKKTEPLADWPTRQLLESFLEDAERQEAEWVDRFGEVQLDGQAKEIQQWLKDQGGLFGILEMSPEQLPEWGNLLPGSYRHPRQCNRGDYPICASAFGNDPGENTVIGEWIEDPATDARIIRIMIYIWLLNEMDAVDYLATIFYDTPGMPEDFHYDAARHLWDESRHSQFGFRQLPRMGFDLGQIEQQVELYEILVQMNPAERYAMMTMQFEAGSFGIKATVMERVRELNDFEADTLLAFDRNDEQNHVRYGHRWIQPLLEEFGHKGDVEAFLKQTNEKFNGIHAEVSAQLSHTLEVAQRLTANDVRERILAPTAN